MKTILLFILLLTPSVVYTADWNYLGKNREGHALYYDKDSISFPDKTIEYGWFGAKKSITNKDIVGVWVKELNVDGYIVADPSLVKLQCSTRKCKNEEMSGYESFPPGTLLDNLYKIVCK